MGRKKSKIVLVIVIVLIIILILLAGIAYCYFATDLFKSNKQLFFEYIGQIGNAENGFVENNLTQYNEKKKNTPYSNKGEFSLEVTSEGVHSKEYENINNFNISFSGQVDKLGDKTIQNISLNYSEDVNFPLSFKQIGNIIGLQTKYVSSKYLSVETDNTENLELTNSSIDIENLMQITFTEEDLKHIQNTYTNVLNTQFQGTQFTKIEDINYVGYSLKLTGSELKNILKQLLETLKNDQITLDKINEYLEVQENSTEITTEIIDNYIKKMEENEEINNENLTITVYGQNNETKKIVLETNEIKVQLEKIQENDSLKYAISVSTLEESTTITLTASYDGLSTMQNISEKYEVEIAGMPDQENLEYKYQLSNNITFENGVNIEEFSDENAMMLTDYDSETVSNFLASVGERIQQVNKEQMEELGLGEMENPIFQLIMPFAGAVIYNQAQDIIDEVDINALEISTFNEKFQIYEGTNIKGTTVKGLLTTIARNNGIDNEDDLLSGKSTPNHLITEINFNGEEYEVNAQNITFIKNEMKLDGYYRVEFEMDEESGAIFRTVINEKVGE